jgi:putative redox protein
MSSFEFGHVVGANAAGITANPAARIAHYKVESRQEEGLRSRVNIRQFTFDVDEPASLAGTDTAPSPVEYALAALATCQEITYRLHADALGVPLDGVAVTLEGDIDLRGFFGSDASIRPGFLAIRGTVTLDSPAPAEDLERLRTYVNSVCPVLDLITNPTPVQIDLITTSAREGNAAA